MVEEENCVFFLPHKPRSEVVEVPVFLFMKGTGININTIWSFLLLHIYLDFVITKLISLVQVGVVVEQTITNP